MPGTPPGPSDEGAPGRAEDPEELLEELLLDGPRRYTRLDVARLAGLPPERTQRLWRALGFADVPDDDLVFTDADVAALGRLRELIDSGFVDAETEASIARAMGQSLSRLADWQTDLIAATLAGPTGPRSGPAGVANMVAATERLLPLMRDLHDYVWRRHLAANAGRLLPTHRGQVDRRDLTVGFADLVGYTTRSRGMGGRELGVMVEDFESLAADVIARHHGRVVKTVGDGVLFTCAVPVDAVEIALQLPEEWSAADRPPLRVGAAYGRVLTRLGDVYSPVVNLASRLTSIARPSTVLVDEALARHLRGVRAYRVRPLNRVSVRGYDRVQPWLVRRATPADHEGAGVHALEDLLDEIADDVLDPAGEPLPEEMPEERPPAS